MSALAGVGVGGRGAQACACAEWTGACTLPTVLTPGPRPDNCSGHVFLKAAFGRPLEGSLHFPMWESIDRWVL